MPFSTYTGLEMVSSFLKKNHSRSNKNFSKSAHSGGKEKYFDDTKTVI